MLWSSVKAQGHLYLYLYLYLYLFTFNSLEMLSTNILPDIVHFLRNI
jgi:hypothetical protein